VIEVAPGWSIDATRGPDWLFVRIHSEDSQWGSADGLADAIWHLLRQHFTNRVVLEMDELNFMPSALMGELVRLYKRVEGSGGLMRLSGLSSSNLDVLRLTRLDRCFPHFATRTDAVMGIRSGGHS